MPETPSPSAAHVSCWRGWVWRYSVILHTNYRPAQQASFSRFLHLHWLRLKLLLETSLLPEWQTLCVTGNNTDRTKVSHISTEKDQNKNK